jgi:Fructose-1-6-bisphosphatase, N-terminal domain
MLSMQGFSVAFDPLDGSSIVDTNFTVGTIFGVWPGDKLTGITGRDQAAAGMGIYGPRTIFCIALKDAPGTSEFLLQARCCSPISPHLCEAGAVLVGALLHVHFCEGGHLGKHSRSHSTDWCRNGGAVVLPACPALQQYLHL